MEDAFITIVEHWLVNKENRLIKRFVSRRLLLRLEKKPGTERRLATSHLICRPITTGAQYHGRQKHQD